MNYTKFDRHECFTSEMMEMTRSSIREIEDLALAQNKSMFNSVTNMLYGLYDGYLYDDLLPDAIEFGVTKEIENKIRGLKKAIEMFIQLTEVVTIES